MIITLTGNLLAERTFVFDDWAPGKTQRAACESFQVGGKGVNVSRKLARLGARTVALLFAGGASGAECLLWLAREGVEHRVFRTCKPTRTGLVVVGGAAGAAGAGRAETTFLGPDVAPDEAAIGACAAWLDEDPVAHVLAFCGSFPGWSAPAAKPLRDAIERRMARGGLVCADTYGAPLAWFAERGAALVKINRAEFDILARDAAAGDSALASLLSPENPMPARLEAARRRWPAVRGWVVTDGPRPVWHATGATDVDGNGQRWTTMDNNAVAAAPAAGHSALQLFGPSAISSCQPPAIREVSPTGAGDVLFACVLHGLVNRGRALAEAVAEAMPFAAAKAAAPREHEQAGGDKGA